MIRIDLGKADAGRGGKKNLFADIQLRFATLIGGKVKKGPVPGKALFVMGIALALSYLPHLFYTRFREIVIEQHQETKKKLEEDLAVVSAEVAKFQPFQAELKSYEEQKKLVKDRLDVVYSLLSNRGTPVNVFDAIGQNLPRRAWILDLDFAATPAVQKLMLSGQSFGNEDISDYLDKLTESIYFSDVKLEDVGQAKIDGNVDVRTFRISAKPKVRPMNVTPNANRASAGVATPESK